MPKMESPFSAVFSAAKLAELIQRTGQVKPDAVNQNNTQRKRHFPEIDINKIIKERMEELGGGEFMFMDNTDMPV